MKKVTDKPPALTVVPDCGPAIPAEYVARFAGILADRGYTPEFCRRQPQDQDLWDLVADEMDRRAEAAGAR